MKPEEIMYTLCFLVSIISLFYIIGNMVFDTNTNTNNKNNSSKETTSLITKDGEKIKKNIQIEKEENEKRKQKNNEKLIISLKQPYLEECILLCDLCFIITEYYKCLYGVNYLSFMSCSITNTINALILSVMKVGVEVIDYTDDIMGYIDIKYDNTTSSFIIKIDLNIKNSKHYFETLSLDREEILKLCNYKGRVREVASLLYNLRVPISNINLEELYEYRILDDIIHIDTYIKIKYFIELLVLLVKNKENNMRYL